MMYFIIKSLTSDLGKRDTYKDADLKFTYRSGINNKEAIIPAGQELVISCENLPIEIQKYRMKNLVTVRETKKPNEANNSAKLKTSTFKKENKPKITTTPTSSIKKKSTSKKTKKSTTTTVEPKDVDNDSSKS